MALFGLRILLFCIVAGALFYLCTRKLGIGARIIAAIKRPFAKNRLASTDGKPVNEKGDTKTEANRQPNSMYGLQGKCEICEQEFSPTSSVSANRLNHVAYEFYGRRREKKICKKCLQLLKKDPNCKIIKIYN